MYIFTKTLYLRLSELLLERLVSDSLHMVEIEFKCEECSVKFNSTLFPTLTKLDYPEGLLTVVVDLIPVWWSLRTFVDGVETLNDFDFNLLKEEICHT